MSEDFDEPTVAPTGDRVDMNTFVNKLIIVRPLEYKDKFVTIHKPDGAEAVWGDVALLDAYEGEPYKIFRNILFMQGYLVGAFKSSLGKRLLGTLYLGPKTKGKPPFHFKTLTDNEKAVTLGKKWLAEHLEEFMTQPQPSFEEASDERRTTLDSMRNTAASNPWMNDEPPF